jgi:hypothetical protein
MRNIVKSKLFRLETADDIPAFYITKYEWSEGYATDFNLKPVQWNTYTINTGYHLYATIDERPKVGDWYISGLSGSLRNLKDDHGVLDKDMKVIATTDKKIKKKVTAMEAIGSNSILFDDHQDREKEFDTLPEGLIREYIYQRGFDQVFFEQDEDQHSSYSLKKDPNGNLVYDIITDRLFGRKEVLKFIDDVLIEYSDKTLADIPEWVLKNIR